MQNHAVVEGCANDWISSPIANLLRPAHHQSEGERRRAVLAHVPDHGQVAPLEGHHHQDVGIKDPVPLTTGQGPRQNHLLRCIVLHQLLGERQQRAWRTNGAAVVVIAFIFAIPSACRRPHRRPAGSTS
jgi:hypothetical protein